MNNYKQISGELYRKVVTLSQKKFRQKYNIFLVEGEKMVESLQLFPDWKIHTIIVSESFPVHFEPEVQKWVDRHPVVLASETEMAKMSNMSTPPGIMALVYQREWMADPIKDRGFYFCLDGIRDPGNLGTIIRVADWFGFKGVICSPDCVDVYNSKTIQATMGSVFSVPVWSMERDEMWEHFSGFKWVAADAGGTALSAWTWSLDTVIVIGSESHGIGPFFLDRIPDRVSIKGVPDRFAESLNAGVAASIFAASATRCL
jgi:RNA methyltransferase, TrmH family